MYWNRTCTRAMKWMQCLITIALVLNAVCSASKKTELRRAMAGRWQGWWQRRCNQMCPSETMLA
eukprot:11188296-Lingulodinium_polyedra.AAC.1